MERCMYDYDVKEYTIEIDVQVIDTVACRGIYIVVIW